MVFPLDLLKIQYLSTYKVIIIQLSYTILELFLLKLPVQNFNYELRQDFWEVPTRQGLLN